jgi:Fe-S-cluster-containing dehydrogenase component
MENGKMLMALPDKCTGCNRCVLACSAAHEGVFQPSMARIHVSNFPLRGYSVPSICFHCPKPECLDACPEKAIYKSESGEVLVDAEKCDGCGDCVAACTYGMIEQRPGQGKAFKCDLCGGDPACVKECRYEALVWAEPDSDLRRLRGLQMKQRSQDGAAPTKRHRLGKALVADARS